MKAELFVLLMAACVVGMFAYVFVGGLVVRAWNALPNTQCIDGSETPIAATIWPFLLLVVVGLALGQLCHLALRLSQWRPKRESTLPGARVVKP